MNSWATEACPHCKGYPGYDECECPEQVLALRVARQEFARGAMSREEFDAHYKRAHGAE